MQTGRKRDWILLNSVEEPSPVVLTLKIRIRILAKKIYIITFFEPTFLNTKLCCYFHDSSVLDPQTRRFEKN